MFFSYRLWLLFRSLSIQGHNSILRMDGLGGREVKVFSEYFLVDRLEGEITRRARELLMASYSETWEESMLLKMHNTIWKK